MWITTGVAAEKAGVTRHTIQQAIASGTLKATKRDTPNSAGYAWFIEQADLDQWIRTKKRGKPAGKK